MPPPLIPAEDLAAIASADPRTNWKALARRLGRRYGTVLYWANKIKAAGGWYCPLTLVPCSECSLPISGPTGRTAHPSCVARREVRRNREKRRWLVGASSPLLARKGEPDPEKAIAYQAANRVNSLRYYHALPDDERGRLSELWQQRSVRDQQRTLPHARNWGRPWTDAEDTYVWDHQDVAARDVGLAIGRTTYAVCWRRQVLRWRREVVGDQSE